MSGYYSEDDKAKVAYLLGRLAATSEALRDTEETYAIQAADRLDPDLEQLRRMLFPGLEPPAAAASAKTVF